MKVILAFFMIQLKYMRWQMFSGRVFGVLMMCFLVVPLGVLADAWWGKGARQSE